MTAVLRRLFPADLAGRAATLSLVANLGLMVLKLSVGVITGSVAVLSDGVDSAQAGLAAALALGGGRVGAAAGPPRPPRPRPRRAGRGAAEGAVHRRRRRLHHLPRRRPPHRPAGVHRHEPRPRRDGDHGGGGTRPPAPPGA